MRVIAAVLIAIFGLYIVWGATGYVFDAKPSDGSKAYFWATGVAVMGALLIAASKKLAIWFAEGLSGDEQSVDARLGYMLYRLFGLYVLYSQVTELAQWIFVLTGLDLRSSYANLPPEYTNYAMWKVFLQCAIVGFAIVLTLTPKRVDAWLSKFELK